MTAHDGKTKTRAHQPRLRFPEFRETGGWEQMPLAKVCNVLQGYGFPEALQGKSEGKYPFCKVSDISRAVAKNGGVLAAAANYVDDRVLLKLRAKPIPKGATVFAKIGEALRLNRRAYVQKECLIDNNATGLKSIDGISNDYFIYIISQLIDLNKYCGGAVPSVNKSTLEEVQVVVPSPNEQQKIADCLSSIDALITAEEKKQDALKAHKKGLMQQLFPAEGETIPRLRFPEFRETGGWKEKKISQIAETNKGRGISKADIAADGRKLCIRYGELYTSYGEVISEVISRTNLPSQELFFSQKGDVIIPSSGETKIDIATASCVMQDNVALGSDLNVIRSRQNGIFLSYYINGALRSRIAKIAQGDSVVHLYPNQIEQLTIALPSTREQQKIADCLSSIDALITAQSRKIAALKAHKQGLMQRLFPVSDEAPE